MPKKPGRGGPRINSGRPKNFDEKTIPVRLPESIAADIVDLTKNSRPALEQLLVTGEVISRDEFYSLPEFSWSVTEMLPNPLGGITVRGNMIYSEEGVPQLKNHFWSMVQSGALKPGKIRTTSPFSIEIFFGHPEWSGESMGYRINVSPDEFNFTTLRLHLQAQLVEGSCDDFVGPLVVHQSDSTSIDITQEINAITLNLLRDPQGASRYFAFQAPGSKTFTFDTIQAAERARHLAQTIIDRSSCFMAEVEAEFGLGKYRTAFAGPESE